MAAQEQRRDFGPGEDRNVDLRPHNRERNARHPVACLPLGGYRRVPRIRD